MSSIERRRSSAVQSQDSLTDKASDGLIFAGAGGLGAMVVAGMLPFVTTWMVLVAMIVMGIVVGARNVFKG